MERYFIVVRNVRWHCPKESWWSSTSFSMRLNEDLSATFATLLSSEKIISRVTSCRTFPIVRMHAMWVFDWDLFLTLSPTNFTFLDLYENIQTQRAINIALCHSLWRKEARLWRVWQRILSKGSSPQAYAIAYCTSCKVGNVCPAGREYQWQRFSASCDFLRPAWTPQRLFLKWIKNTMRYFSSTWHSGFVGCKRFDTRNLRKKVN